MFGVGPLVPITGTMNSDKYIATLTQHLLPAAQHWFGGSPWQLLQDGAPCHKSIKTTQFLNANGIDCVPWPSYSPDMNAIENVWNVLKRKLFRFGSGGSRDELIAKATHIWNTDPDVKATATACVQSMQHRVSELVLRKGGHTHY